MQVRAGETEGDIRAAVDIDARATGSRARAGYIAMVAERGGLTLAQNDGSVVGFCCLDHTYFFEKPFISLLIVDKAARRHGVGTMLLDAVSLNHAEIWTSTNRSNSDMRRLLAKPDWQFCGELDGLDPGDPELFFKKAT